MWKEILEALQQKFPGVEAKWLEPMARKLAKDTTNKEDIPAAVEAVTTSQVMGTYADYRVNQAVATASAKAVTDYEEKFNLKDGKPVEGGTPGQKTQPTETKPSEEEPAWAKALSERMTNMEKRFTEQDESAKQSGLHAKLVSILKEKEVRESFYGPVINGRTFKDEDEVKAFAETVEQSFKDDQQAVANASHSGSGNPDQGGGGDDEDPLLKAVQEKTDSITASKNK